MTDEKLWDKVSTPGFVTNKEHQDVMNKAIHMMAIGKDKEAKKK